TDVDGGWINNQGRDVHAACYSDKHLIFAPNLRMNPGSFCYRTRFCYRTQRALFAGGLAAQPQAEMIARRVRQILLNAEIVFRRLN
ncbi:MAG: hypothetical protein QOH25_1903, partial [Acidobacteriota bacterium]|nr:hypothetical protein [Acidobacteriota bacterium]